MLMPRLFLTLLLVVPALSTQAGAAVATMQAATSDAANDSPSVSFIEGFDAPEDLLDIVGTPFLFVSEYAGSPVRMRNIAGEISVFDSIAQQRLELQLVIDDTVLSPLADPTCQNLPFDQIAPHGITGHAIPNGNGTWEIAMVNHFLYESVEFYEFDPLQPAQVTTRGCVQLIEGDFHNSVSYSPDFTQMAVTVFFTTFLGFGGYLSAVGEFFGLATDGALKIISTGGTVETVNTALSGPNGVLWGGVNGNQVFVAESPRNRIMVLDSSASFEATSLLIPANIVPDNLAPDSQSSLLFTAVTFPVLPFFFVLFCQFGLIPACGVLGFEVYRYDWVQETTTLVYEQGASEILHVTDAQIKDSILYVGSYVSNGILRVEI